MDVDVSAIAIILSVIGVGIALGRMIQALRADMHREMDLRFAQVDQRFAHVDQRLGQVDQSIAELRGDVRELRHDVSNLREEMGVLRERTTQAAGV